jgi:hypothetical protein
MNSLRKKPNGRLPGIIESCDEDDAPFGRVNGGKANAVTATNANKISSEKEMACERDILMKLTEDPDESWK